MYHQPFPRIDAIKTLGLADDSNARNLMFLCSAVARSIMETRNWRVKLLTEFLPQSPRLLGVNVNRGVEVRLRLRERRESIKLLSFESVMHTFLHELVHCTIGPHNSAFYGLLEEIRLHAELEISRKFNSLSLIEKSGWHVLGGAENSFLNGQWEVAMAKAAIPDSAQRRRSKIPKGTRLGGSKRGLKKMTQRELTAAAAERRLADSMACGVYEEAIGSGETMREEAVRDTVERNDQTHEMHAEFIDLCSD